jgi:hypothetical protein
MTIARSRQVNLETTPYYHVIGRCYSQGRRIFQTGKIWGISYKPTNDLPTPNPRRRIGRIKHLLADSGKYHR